jgi:hypothetical protein
MSGDKTNGLKLLERAIAIQSKKLGKDHPAVAETSYWLGLVHFELAKSNKSAVSLKQAREYMQRSYEIRMKKWGSAHPETQETANSLKQFEQFPSKQQELK